MLAVMSVHETVPLVTDRPRRTFAIISHPDAGKTTLTEKLLMFGGAIRLAGHVRARGDRRRTQSDWMEIERDRGISITSSVMTFEHDGITFNLLDTPGHQDFSEDTYRTLPAVDSAVMVLDAARAQGFDLILSADAAISFAQAIDVTPAILAALQAHAGGAAPAPASSSSNSSPRNRATPLRDTGWRSNA